MKKIRADELLSKDGTITRSQARLLIMEGKVSVKGRTVMKPGELVPEDSCLEIAAPPKFVGRGGHKLEHALEKFGLSVEGLIAIDVGASTGGFTDCLLQRGAKKVYAVDVGRSQLAQKVACDPRVVVMDETNARNLLPEMFPERPQFACVDCSFISGDKVIAPLKNLLGEPGLVVWLLKPQFEAGPGKVGKGGVIRKDNVLEMAITEALDRIQAIGASVIDCCESPIRGADGNREYLVLVRFGGAGIPFTDCLARMLKRDQNGEPQN